jgi:aspartyl-tRNA(Asn)/glutamyl-tRNA(Gln) amidotransferase subunit C
MITDAEINKLATLSRIKLTPEETQSLIKEVGAILAYVDEIKKASIAEMPQEASVGAVKNITRADVAENSGVQEAILDEAPDREGDFIGVKKILG